MSPGELVKIESAEGHVNTPLDYRTENIRANIARMLPQMQWRPPTGGMMIIAAGGPSLETHFDELVKLHRGGVKLMTVNNVHEIMYEHGIEPSAHVMLDSQNFMARFVAHPMEKTKYFICSQSHPSVFDALEDRQVIIWHESPHDVLDHYYRGNYAPISGGTTVATRAITIARMLGYADLHMFGFDSCLVDGEHHAYPQPENEKDKIISVFCNGREFKCAPWMARQALDFIDMIKTNGDHFRLDIHGDGLIKHMLESAHLAILDKQGMEFTQAKLKKMETG